MSYGKTKYNKTIDEEHKLRIKTRRESLYYGMGLGILTGFSLYVNLSMSFAAYMIISTLLAVVAIYITYRILQYRRGLDVELKKVFTR